MNNQKRKKIQRFYNRLKRLENEAKKHPEKLVLLEDEV
jgi:uncharacterized Fe-S cluster-containing radical SAM superfamily enzyme